MADQERSPRPPSTASPAEMDATDRAILRLLRDDGRVPVADLARAVHVSRANAYTRLERLRAAGVLQGFSARVDPARAGLGLCAVVLLALVPRAQPRWRELREQLVAMPEIEYAALVTGEADVLLMVRAADMDALRAFLLERVQAMESVRSTRTLFVLEELLHRPYVLPPEPGS